ncbi:MAG: PBP1A family penicillin-binding protein [Proteobacteria bacterium]|nr:PBP1A family penicillin-binding protein [Pseudomonadota bacterium]
MRRTLKRNEFGCADSVFKKIFYATFLLVLLLACAGGIAAFWAYNYITRDLPDFHTVEEYLPPAVTTVLASDQTVVGEFFEERRYPVKLKEVPIMVRNCFLAAEDASFYKHSGIDPVSILRAIVKNLERGSASQGGSTITQQVVKNMLLTPEKKLVRKAKEAILSYRLERRLSKDGILEIYLNQIFFGNNAYGIKAAARAYYRKELSQLTLAEAAMLAGLPKAPTKYSPILSYARAKRRQHYVLGQMVRAGFASKAEVDAAEREDVKVYPATAQNIFRSPYYVSEVRRVLGDRWKELDIDRGGYVIHTALDLEADAMATASVRRGLREVDKRRGWRGPLGSIPKSSQELFVKRYGALKTTDLKVGDVYPALVEDLNASRKTLMVSLGATKGTVDLKEAGWAKKRLGADGAVSWGAPESQIQVGDVVEVSLVVPTPVPTPRGKKASTQVVEPPPVQFDKFQLDQTPELEAALTVLDPFSGKVLTVVGGYSYQRSVFNRATQSWRQPGSAFKPIVYLTAIDQFNYTPGTIVHDEPHTFKVGNELWTPGNFDGKFMGPITLQSALEHSRNLVSAEIVSRIGLDSVIQTARKMGITSKIGRNISIALGSSEVTPLELTRAYGVLPTKGVLFPSTFVTRIEDRLGKVIYDFDQERLTLAQQVIDPASAFIITHMMQGVIQRGTGYLLKQLNRPLGGKTGTSNDQMDAWFVGFTPAWVCGVWVGFDVKKEIGDKETGGRVAAPIFLYFMQDFLAKHDLDGYQRLVDESKADAERLGIDYLAPEKPEPAGFTPPEGVDPFWMDLGTGQMSQEGAQGAVFEYYKRGTQPGSGADATDTTSYLDSPDL